MLFFVRERFPTFRVDVSVLFGAELLGRGHEIDFVMQAATAGEAVGRTRWQNRTVWVGKKEDRKGFIFRIKDHALAVWHDLSCLRYVSPVHYDAVQVKDKFFVAPIIYLVAKARRLKFFYWLSFPLPDAQLVRARDPRTRFRRLIGLRGRMSRWLLYKWLLPRADHVFVQSERMKADVAQKGVPVRQITAVPMGVPSGELNDIEDADRPWPRDGIGPLRLVYLGTLARTRGLEILIDMLLALRDARISVHLVMVGDGNEPQDRGFIESYAEQLGVREMLSITGFLPRAEALRWAQSADVALSPFLPTPILLSTSPTKLVEYLSLELPVVANDHPEQRLVLRQSRGGICVPWGSRYFARAVAWMSRLSPEQRKQMGVRGRQWIKENRSYERIGTMLEEKYLALLPNTADVGRANH
jgi:glycosyltransferase involved in cell wall biosynthesis